MSSIAAHDAAVATGAMPQILLWVSAFEAISSVAVVQMLEGSGRMPGDFGFDPYNLYSKPEMAKKRVRWLARCVASGRSLAVLKENKKIEDGTSPHIRDGDSSVKL